jgi:hypothetical protein
MAKVVYTTRVGNINTWVGPFQPLFCLNHEILRVAAPFAKATHSWEMLQDIKDAKPNDTRYPVVLHGFVTATRTSSGSIDYLDLLDPKLRSRVQVKVTKQLPSVKHALRGNAEKVNDVNLSAPASRADGEMLEKSPSRDDSDALPQISREDEGMDSQLLPEHSSDHTPEADAHVSLKGMEVSDMSFDQQTSPTTPNQNNETSPEDEKITEQDAPAQLVNPVCRAYQKMRPHTPVVVRGLVCLRRSRAALVKPDTDGPDEGILRGVPGNVIPGKERIPRFQDPFVGWVDNFDSIVIKATSIIPLNDFPATIIAKSETNFPPEQRHLQLRTKSQLRQNIRSRSKAMAQTRMFMFMKGFDEIETPLLFKSTPDGARAFMVPTRRKGMAYTLPQSPQQYKQILMASGVSRYFQFARCFRDEDMRADRQPEFTQVSRASALMLISRTNGST